MFKRVVLCITAVLILLISVSCFEKKEDLLKKGNDLVEQEKYNEAIEYYDKALNIDSVYVDALIGKGIALYDRGDPTAALETFDKAQKLDLNNLTILVYRGKILNNLHKYEEAIESFDKALELDPKQDVKIDLSNSYAGQANNLLEKAGETGSKGNIEEALSIVEEILPVYDKALNLDPECINALYGKGRAMVLKGIGNNDQQFIKNGISYFDKVLELDPDHKEAKRDRDKAFNMSL